MQEHTASLAPKMEFSRREFVVGGLATAGFALAVQPIQAQSVITTDSNGLVAGEINIPTTLMEVSLDTMLGHLEMEYIQ